MQSRSVTRYVAIYCRISKDKRGRLEGVEAQERWGRDYAASAWPGLPVEVFADNDLSAADDTHRPHFERFREWVAAGKIAHVWAVEQSRLERREVEWFRLAAELDAAGIAELHTNRDGLVRVRDEIAGIKAVLNAGEVRKLKKRVNDRLAENAANGRPAGSLPFGYSHGVNADGDKTYVMVPAQAEAIRWAADKVLAGWSLSNVAAELRARGLRGAHGGEIQAAAVRSMISNPTIAGHRVHQGRTVGRGNWEAILDEDTWQAVRAKLDADRVVRRKDGRDYPVTVAHNGNPAGRRYLLTGGLAVCGVCTKPLYGSLKQLRNKSRGVFSTPYLLCHPKLGGRGCVGIMLDRTEQHVVDYMFAELDKPEFLEAVAADSQAERRNAILAALQAVEGQRDELAEMWATPGELTAAEWRTARRALAEHEQGLRAELAAVPPTLAGVDIAAARAEWPGMTLDEQREFLRIFVEKVTIKRARPGTKGFDAGRVETKMREWGGLAGSIAPSGSLTLRRIPAGTS
jgi:site-specific DNA recombinase